MHEKWRKHQFGNNCKQTGQRFKKISCGHSDVNVIYCFGKFNTGSVLLWFVLLLALVENHFLNPIPHSKRSFYKHLLNVQDVVLSHSDWLAFLLHILIG